MKDDYENNIAHEKIINLFKDKTSRKMDDNDLEYLNIFNKPCFKFIQDYENLLPENPDYLSDTTLFNSNDKSSNQYDFPVNVIGLMLFTWTKHLLRAANEYPRLETSHLGQFSPKYQPEYLLKEIKAEWEIKSKKETNNPLLKSLININKYFLIGIFLMSVVVGILDSTGVMLYNQIILHLDKSEKKPNYSMSTTIIFMLFLQLLYNLIFRSVEAYAGIFSYKLYAQLILLIYDKLLKISPYSNISEGAIINFISTDAESFSEFLSYTPASLVLPFQILFYIYVLFGYFGYAFIFGLSALLLIFITFIFLQKARAGYQKEMLYKKDKRVKTTTQVFEKIKILKLYSWEDYYLEKIKKEREEELLIFKKIQIIYLLIESISWSSGPILSLVSFYSFNRFYEPMELSQLLTSLYIFQSLIDPLFLIPEYINGLIDSLISLKRIESFLHSKEYNPTQLLKNINNFDNKKIMIDIDNIDFGLIKKDEEFLDYEDEDNDEELEDEESEDNKISNFTKIKNPEIVQLTNKREEKIEKLNDKNIQEKSEKKSKEKIVIKGVSTEILLKKINLKVKEGSIIGIVGEFGSGKTILFNAILNNLDIVNGPNKKIIVNGSVSYVPQNTWIKNDTVRNNIIFHQKYNEEKYKKIIEICQLKPDFEIFAKGDLTQISDKGDNLSGGQKARINIARAVYNDADIYLFDDPFSALDAYVGSAIFNKVILGYLRGKTILVITHALQYIPMMDYVIHMYEGQIDYFGEAKTAIDQPFFKELISLEEQKKFKDINNGNIYGNEKNLDIIENNNLKDSNNEINYLYLSKNIKNLEQNDQKTTTQNLKFGAFKIVFSYSGGFIIFTLIFIATILWKSLDSISDFIIAAWSTKEESNHYFRIYFFAKILAILFEFLKGYAIVHALMTFNKNMHNTLLIKLLKAPVNLFHDLIKRSHIINRLTKDLGNSPKYFWSLNSSLILFFHIINGLYFTTYFFWKSIFISIIFVILNLRLYNYYLKCAKGLNLLEAYTRGPLLTSVSETISGIVSIRAYEKKETFKNIFFQRLYNLYRIFVYQDGTSSWFALNVDFICFFYLSVVLIFIWSYRDSNKAGLLGLLLNYVLKLLEHSYNFFNNFNNLERMSTSIELCEAYTNVVQEAPWKLETDKILIENKFPLSGKIQFVNYSVKYRPDTKIVLENLNFTINHGEKIGIVGRTGSGKSTLALCLCRVIEASSGKILIDDVDISLIGLSLLRNIISIIPQDPTLMKGTLRENLDPLGKSNDNIMITQLKLLDLDYLLDEGGLDFLIKDNGNNLSAGERQLICIARSMLRNSKIIIMDEATSSIDYSTEKLIQKAILTTLKNSTVITIAHRIKTIIEYDRIFVLDKGVLVEQGSPKNLLKNKQGSFYKLYSQSHL